MARLPQVVWWWRTAAIAARRLAHILLFHDLIDDCDENLCIFYHDYEFKERFEAEGL